MLKIFAVGLPRTATTSLASALEILGYKTLHQCYIIDGTYLWNEIIRDVDNNDAIVSTCFHCFYKRLNIHYPNSKFILTVRDKSSWKKSLLNYSPTYNQPDPNNYTERIINYFNNDPNKLLIMNICNGDGWNKLCSFLKCSIPCNTAFPWENQTEN